MPEDLKPYVVCAGDHLARLAYQLDFDADTVWSHPRNAHIAKLRAPNLLQPGDVLWIPADTRRALRLVAGGTNTFVADIPKTRVRLLFQDHGGPIVSAACGIRGAGKVRATQTDGEGKLTVDVPVTVREFCVVFAEPAVTFPILVGDMDPVDEPSGVRKRLVNLGLHRETHHRGVEFALHDEESAACLADALRAFQRRMGLQETGEADEATRAALAREHGS